MIQYGIQENFVFAANNNTCLIAIFQNNVLSGIRMSNHSGFFTAARDDGKLFVKKCCSAVLVNFFD